MLVYEPGQFFLPHQDSEKTDDMVATLLVVLPSEYRGGTLVVRNGRSTRRFSPSKKTAEQLTLIAFYADCRHEVRPVEAGHRIVLACNVRMRGDSADSLGRGLPPAGALEAEIARYFETPVADWRHPDAPPDRLVYLLDHDYTPRGLSWRRLKNGDARRAAALRAAAKALDCGIALALADVHEVWGCEDDGAWGRGYGWEARSSSRDDPDDFELIDLQVEETVLSHARDPSGRAVEGHEGRVPAREVCATKPSVEMTPYEAEHEGYMGNYGNTVDRWYHRGALVLWPRSREFAIRAKGSLPWALK